MMMPRAVFIIAQLLTIALCLGGCATSIAGNDANIYHSLNGQRIVGNENSVIISNVWNELDAFPLAEQHCKKYGRSARFKSITGVKAAFDCV
jgi:hypothetical protein